MEYIQEENIEQALLSQSSYYEQITKVIKQVKSS